MALLVNVLAAVFVTARWYCSESARKHKVGLLCFMYWGVSLAWLVDAIAEYIELGAAYFHPEPADMLNDLFLGISVIALALVIWIVVLLCTDPDGVIKK